MRLGAAWLCVMLLTATTHAQTPAPLRWGGDAEGGAPFVEADPDDPHKVAGFDVEIAELIARALGRQPQFVQVAFTSLDQSARARRLRHRPERHRGHPGARANAGRQRSVLRVPRGADRPRRRPRPLPHARRPARPPGRDARRHDRLRPAARGRTAATASSPCRTTTTCIRTRTWLIGRVDAVLLDHVLAERAHAPQHRPGHASRRRRRPATTSSSPRPRTSRCATRSTRILRAAMQRRPARSGSSASGTSGTTTSRSSTRDARRTAGRRCRTAAAAGRATPASRMGADEALPAVAACAPP